MSMSKPTMGVLDVCFDTEQFVESLIDDAMICRAIEAYNQSFSGGQHQWMHAALLAAIKGIDNG